MSVMQALDLGPSSQAIGQADLLPIWLAKLIWGDFIRNCRALYFVDNNSARYAMIKGSSPLVHSAKIVENAWQLDSALGSSSWYARVPSPSNCSDGPSRGGFGNRDLVGLQLVRELESAWDVVLQSLSRS